MTTPSPERRAELRRRAFALLDPTGPMLVLSLDLEPLEMLALLDATDPVADGEVAATARRLRGRWGGSEATDDAASLLKRLAQERRHALDLLAHLVGAASAYGAFAGNNRRPGMRDALYSTRMKDFNAAVERGRKAYRALFGANPVGAAASMTATLLTSSGARLRCVWPLNEPVPEGVLIRHKGKLKGVIAIGEVFAWEPDISTARELCVVVGLTAKDHLKQERIPHATGTAVLAVQRGEGVITRPLEGDGPECWNDMSRFREACMRTRFHPMPAHRP